MTPRRLAKKKYAHEQQKIKMLGLMGGSKKDLEKYLPKEPKVKDTNGKFIAKLNAEYFMRFDSDSGFPITTKYKCEAQVFDDFRKAKELVNRYGGKVIKL